MRISQLLTTTLREAPREAEGINQELLVRAGFVRQLTSGVYSFLPLGNRVLQKIATIIREEMNRAGGQEVIMPVIQPRDIWEVKPADGGPSRAEGVDILFQLKDRKGRDMVLGPTHEEVVTLLAKEFVRSYRDLPQLIYQIQVKLRDEPRPRGGLLRTREFLMKDLYSFDADEAAMDKSYRTIREAYQAIFTRCGLRFIVIEADSGAIGGKDSQEFIALTDAGEDDAVQCSNCGYAANTEKAEFVRSELARQPEADLEEVFTPGCTTINDLADFLHIPTAQTMKAVLYSSGGRLILGSVRGDLEVNEVKLINALRRAGIDTTDLHMATPEELQQAGIVAGFTSPIGKSPDIFILADTSLKTGNNFVGGANRVDYHIKNINYPRDFRVDAWEDIASAYEGAQCVHCGGSLHVVHGSELGHIFKLGTRYSVPFGSTFLDAQGSEQPLLMGCYGIGLGRVMAIAVEQSHDEKGIIWSFGMAPYHLALVGLDLDKGENRQIAEQLYRDLQAAGVEVLFDDRAESAGVKFNDSDLMGLPLRAVVSKRSLKNGGIELKLRSQKESRIVPLVDAVQVIQQEIAAGLNNL
ncbi:proline--tRNA ligase [Dictyobacter formicarum]|uniref:Proline--tRNA ligase n=1 Tax=Dictyobacter formicarum TaxID=2778368 RepID=A0ABQ3VVL6_9CHLR|nr:proline--tRNA ligase [Dictyobacter formicarum]GHO89719.1 proline--tRNA ligase [Dictyobacter formicarum]